MDERINHHFICSLPLNSRFSRLGDFSFIRAALPSDKESLSNTLSCIGIFPKKIYMRLMQVGFHKLQNSDVAIKKMTPKISAPLFSFFLWGMQFF